MIDLTKRPLYGPLCSNARENGGDSKPQVSTHLMQISKSDRERKVADIRDSMEWHRGMWARAERDVDCAYFHIYYSQPVDNA